MNVHKKINQAKIKSNKYCLCHKFYQAKINTQISKLVNGRNDNFNKLEKTP